MYNDVIFTLLILYKNTSEICFFCRCTVPFGLVVLIAGIVVTAVAYSFNSHGSTISYFGLVLLSAGLGLLGLSAVCWKVRLERKKERRRESQTVLVTNHRSIFA
uniref:Transmembrane protein 100 n=1 Tax=Astyanax mexicanus TaxID=7994 RepID=A0A8B9JHU1_ASTMX